ncbi:MAG: lysylphosphatidylglycerol synthase domain-containing protein [Pseudomonadota bacterium]|nr:lysylphosphatidylglycerol synthase domain-containing protein [Pseudomonadota bacterium]
MISKLKFLIFFLIGVFIFKWVYDFFAGPDSFKLILENKERLFFIILAHLPTLYFDSIAWYVLMTRNKIPMVWTFIITWISQASGKFFPTGNITGEFVRIFLATKRGQATSEASSTVLADLIVATFSLFLMAIFSFLYILSLDLKFIFEKDSFYLFSSLLLIMSACFFFFWCVRRRVLRSLFRNILKKFKVSLKRETTLSLVRLDYLLYRLSFKKKKLVLAIFYRLLGWIAGALEIFIFLWIIGIEASILDVILIESFTGIIRSIAFFIPAGLGVQELAFVMIGEFVGLSGTVSFSVAVGRRFRELIVGIPAIIAWLYLFRNKGRTPN